MSHMNIVVFLVRVLLFILNLEPQRQLQQSEANVKSAFSFSCLLFFFLNVITALHRKKSNSHLEIIMTLGPSITPFTTVVRLLNKY